MYGKKEQEIKGVYREMADAKSVFGNDDIFNQLSDENVKKENNVSKDEIDMDAIVEDAYRSCGEEPPKKSVDIEAIKKTAVSELIVSRLIQGAAPVAHAGLYAMKNTVGFDPLGKLSGKTLFNKELKDSLMTSDLDKNLLINMAPSILMTASNFTNNRSFQLGAAATPAIVPVVQNLMAGRSPLQYYGSNKSMDIPRLIIDCIPLLMKIVEPFIKGAGLNIKTDELSAFIKNKISDESATNVAPAKQAIQPSPTTASKFKDTNMVNQINKQAASNF